MKTRLILLAAGLSGLFACSTNGPKEKTDDTVAAADTATATQSRVEITDSVKSRVLADYLRLKNALVASDSTAAGAAAVSLAGSLSNVQGCDDAVKMAGSIQKAATLEQQRAGFVAINKQVIPVMEQVDVKSGKLFVQFCPMANDGKGAYWLSAEKHVRNPYYGDDMLECGAVEKVID